MTQETSTNVDRAFERWAASWHRPAHNRRTAERNASFFLPHLDPGMNLLDIGCGPGSITVGLAKAVAPGLVVGVDPAPEDARRLSPVGVAWLTGVGEYLPFGDQSFDAAFIHFVLQHVTRPEEIIAEAFRVLRPGGYIGTADADFGGSIVGPHSAVVEHSLEVLTRLRQLRPGNPFVGRDLDSLLHSAGFADGTAGATVEVVSGPEATARAGSSQAAYFAAPELRAYALEKGLATAVEMDAMPHAWREWGGTGGAFWARFSCYATARKP